MADGKTYEVKERERKKITQLKICNGVEHKKNKKKLREKKEKILRHY